MHYAACAHLDCVSSFIIIIFKYSDKKKAVNLILEAAALKDVKDAGGRTALNTAYLYGEKNVNNTYTKHI